MCGSEQYLNVLQTANNCLLKKTCSPLGVGNARPIAVSWNILKGQKCWQESSHSEASGHRPEIEFNPESIVSTKAKTQIFHSWSNLIYTKFYSKL